MLDNQVTHEIVHTDLVAILIDLLFLLNDLDEPGLPPLVLPLGMLPLLLQLLLPLSLLFLLLFAPKLLFLAHFSPLSLFFVSLLSDPCKSSSLLLCFFEPFLHLL